MLDHCFISTPNSSRHFLKIIGYFSQGSRQANCRSTHPPKPVPQCPSSFVAYHQVQSFLPLLPLSSADHTDFLPSTYCFVSAPSSQAFPGNPESTLANFTGRIVEHLYISIHSQKSHLLVSFPALQKANCYSLSTICLYSQGLSRSQ